MRSPSLIVVGTLFLFSSALQAKGNGSSTGISLLDPMGARPAALGESFTAVADDITAFEYNPASLQSLTQGQASFLYNKGLSDDVFAHASIGGPSKWGGLGLSVGIYNAGDIDLFDGTTSRKVTAKSDVLATLGVARNVGRVSIGVAAKYFSSELIEQAKATAVAGDVGVQMQMNPQFRAGAALQNFGSQLKFVSESNNLPRIARIGMTGQLATGRIPLNGFFDVPYHFNEAQLRPGVGLECPVGPLAFRVGYKIKNDQQQVSFGTGFVLKNMSLDYSYGMVSDLNASHKFSLSMKFGEAGGSRQLTRSHSEKLYELTQSAITFVRIPESSDFVAEARNNQP